MVELKLTMSVHEGGVRKFEDEWGYRRGHNLAESPGAAPRTP